MTTAAIQLGSQPFAPVARHVPRGRFGWIAFLALTAILILRPDDLMSDPTLGPEYQHQSHFYEITILAALAAALPGVIRQLSFRSLISKPITLCVFGLLFAMFISLIAQGQVDDAWSHASEFAKICIYFILLLAIANTPERLRTLLFWLAICVTAMAFMAVLQYHEIINLPALAPVVDREALDMGGELKFVRLRGPGIFNDPNDICHVLDLSILICCYALSTIRGKAKKLFWLAILGVLAYAVILTQSRGGLLGLISGLFVLFVARYGWRKALLPALILLAGVALFSSRQTDLSTGASTAQDRIKLWSDALVDFRMNPAFGMGVDNFVKDSGLVTHNSFMQSYAEMGFLGGTLFLGAFFIAVRSTLKSRSQYLAQFCPELSQLRPFLMSVLVQYIVGMMSLSRGYVVPTYMVLGIATAYQQCAGAFDTRSWSRLRLSPRLVAQVIALSIGFIAFMYVFVSAFRH